MNEIKGQNNSQILRQNEAKLEKVSKPSNKASAKSETKDEAKIALNTEALIKSRTENIEKILNGAYLDSEKEDSDPSGSIYIKDAAYYEIHPEGFKRLYTDANEAIEDGDIDNKKEFREAEFENNQAYDLVLLDGRRVTASFHKSTTSAGHDTAVFKLTKNETIHLSDVFTFKKNEPIQATAKKADAVSFDDGLADLDKLADEDEGLILPKKESHKLGKTYEKTIPRERNLHNLSSQNYQNYKTAETKFKIYDLLHLQLKSNALTLARQTEKGLVELGSNRSINAKEIHAYKKVTANVSDEIYSIPGFSMTREDEESGINTKFRITGFRDGINIYPITEESIGQGENKAGRGYRDSDLAKLAKKAPNFVDFTTDAEDGAKENMDLHDLWESNPYIRFLARTYGDPKKPSKLSTKESSLASRRDELQNKGYSKFYSSQKEADEYTKAYKAEALQLFPEAKDRFNFEIDYKELLKEEFKKDSNYKLLLVDGREITASYKGQKNNRPIFTNSKGSISATDILYYKAVKASSPKLAKGLSPKDILRGFSKFDEDLPEFKAGEMIIFKLKDDSELLTKHASDIGYQLVDDTKTPLDFNDVIGYKATGFIDYGYYKENNQLKAGLKAKLIIYIFDDEGERKEAVEATLKNSEKGLVWFSDKTNSPLEKGAVDFISPISNSIEIPSGLAKNKAARRKRFG